MELHPNAGTIHAPICPVAISPKGKIISYSRKNLPRPCARDNSLIYVAATGISPPTPMPCTSRQARSMGKFPANAQPKLITDIDGDRGCSAANATHFFGEGAEHEGADELSYIAR